MAMTRVGLRDSNKSLPADIRAAFSPQTYYQGQNRLALNGDVVQNSRSWGRGMRGLGDTCYDADSDSLYDCGSGGVPTDSSVLAGGVTFADLTAAQQAAWLGNNATIPAGATVVPPSSGGGVDAVAIAKIIQAGTAGLVPIIAATSQGVLYKVDPKTGAMTVYSQPAGSTLNLPIGGSLGTFNTPLGSGSVSGFSGSSLLLLGVVGLFAVMAMRK